MPQIWPKHYTYEDQRKEEVTFDYEKFRREKRRLRRSGNQDCLEKSQDSSDEDQRKEEVTFDYEKFQKRETEAATLRKSRLLGKESRFLRRVFDKQQRGKLPRRSLPFQKLPLPLRYRHGVAIAISITIWSSTPLHMVTLSHIAAIFFLIASFLYLLDFFGIDFVQSFIASPEPWDLDDAVSGPSLNPKPEPSIASHEAPPSSPMPRPLILRRSALRTAGREARERSREQNEREEKNATRDLRLVLSSVRGAISSGGQSGRQRSR
ncbi:hypothetical protein Fmac_010613 [Flemingia macrophylla]|uniref:Uncharacterized protein n=1 Tax=Flemingia macrophylla TaxID=520843 RepID=A0ABD1MKT9_9FABA